MTETFGERVRGKRISKGISLRKFAKITSVSPTYMSFIEKKHGVIPTEEDIFKIADLLDENRDELLALGRKISSDIQKIILKHPKEISQFLRLAQSFDRDKWISLTKENNT